MTEPEQPNYDVAVIGGGLVGSMAAIMLRKRGLRVAVLESRARGQALKTIVGESLTEGTSVFLHHEIGLGEWLRDHAFRKYGFDFVTQPHDRPKPRVLDECHELLLSLTPLERIEAAFPRLIPTYHVNRPPLDAEVARRAEAAGAVYMYASSVERVALGEGRHEVVLQGGATVTCKWVLDVSGRRRVLAKQLGISHDLDGLDTAAIWTRFTKVRHDAAFWQTFRGIDRRRHTIHLGGPGFWFWWIHIDDDTTSVGVSFDKTQHQPNVKSEDRGFWEMARKFPALVEALAGAEPTERFSYYAKLGHRTEHWVSPAGYALIGDASGFVDALYSIGIEMACRQLVAVAPLIEAACAGEQPCAATIARLNRDHELMQDSVRLLNKFKYEQAWHQPHVLMQTALYELGEIAELYHLKAIEHWTPRLLARHYRLQWSSEARRRRLVRFMSAAQRVGARAGAREGQPLLAKALLPGRLVYAVTWPLWHLPRARPYFFVITRAWGHMERLSQRLRVWPDFLGLMAGPRRARAPQLDASDPTVADGEPSA
ncbi:FAD-binding protein [Enhygromyxa salina]|uniref:FAD-binding protein n=1 Tax=Enhygromyxa salina TaxID=215803 RepID=A0A0C2D0Y9_9BACT|nr:NAD(P)/FAD-dependent oxidoreductase [Enhygromyxa salina]KIG15510.1 FAD-binding protein [Enhygromyxa salina]